MNNTDIFKTKLFKKLFSIPSISWLLISLIAMIPDNTDPDPLTWSDLIITDLFLLLIWFSISFIISLFIYKMKELKQKSKSKNEIQYTNEVNDELTTESKETIEIINKEIKQYKHPKLIKNGMLILFIITILSLWGALYSMLLLTMNNAEYMFSFVKYTWIFWCWLPIPILSIILGFKYKKDGFKCTKNIVAGFIISFLLLIYGSFWTIEIPIEDYSKIYDYKEIINVQIPNNGILEIQEWETYFDEDKTDYTIINVHYFKENVENLENSIENNNNWILSKEIKSTLKVLIPSQFKSDNDAYYSIYNKTTNQYNTLPEISGEYEIYAMKYDKSEKLLNIHKYKLLYR